MPSYLGIKIEKGCQTGLELLLDLVLAALENMHGDVRIPPIFQFDRRSANLRDLIGGQQTQTVHQCQVCHLMIVSQRLWARDRASEDEVAEWAKLDGRSTRPSTLSRWPLQRAPADQVYVQMKDRLSGAWAHIQHRAVAIFNRPLACNVRRRQMTASH